ncbi:MAG: hypothetical protein KatS3mg124_1233 [Porticoccaceae bacterium]|nr:MAG: hypothetical protein KatS3mg124_1233 [Porticoccaceae bacterium]
MRTGPQGDPAGGRLFVRVHIASLFLDSAELEEGAKSAEWFDAARFPLAEFRSAEIRRLAPGHYQARGRLRLKGVERPLLLPFTWRASGEGAVLAGTARIDRTAFGIGSGEWAGGDLIAREVVVRYRAVFARAP